MSHVSLPEVRQRAIAIRLLHLGHAPEAVVEMLAVAPSTIWNWHRRYRAEGISSLANRAKSGRPAKADAHYLTEVERALDSDPHTLSYAFSVQKDIAIKHSQLIEIVPFFVHPHLQSEEGQRQLCRCIHFLLISPAFAYG